MKAFVVCNGCPENQIDVARAEKYLITNGFQIAKNYQEADIILFNACGLTQETAARSLNIIDEIKRNKTENQQLIVWGCLPKIEPSAFDGSFDGLVSPGPDLPELPKIINSLAIVNQTVANNLGARWPVNKVNSPALKRYKGSFASQICKKTAVRWDKTLGSRINLARDNDKTIFYIKVSTGCRGNCAYCVVQKSRGITKSKPVANVMVEFQDGLRKGFKEFSLVGTDLGSYGTDIGITIIDLLKELVKQDGDFKINLRNMNPRFLKNIQAEFIPILKSGKIRYIEVPAESGSNRILQLMNRHYSIEEYKNLINSLRAAHPSLLIRTQLMVAFPTETEQDFQLTMKLLDELVFDYVEVYGFSERKGTAAENLEPKVSDKTKEERYLKLYKKAILNRTPRKIKMLLAKS
jgi:tRNA A37 methylthiotransferase MiaB